tara:strand:+ start:842 stop:1507 length:666 start_codon:yes stop_codon:yes gene_type:complete
MKELINIHNVDIGYSNNEKVLLSVNLKIREKDFLVINGKNGSGKSTLLKLIYMKILPIAGMFKLFGHRIGKNEKNKILAFRKKIGVILQNNYLIPYLTVRKNVEISIHIQNKEIININERIKEIIKWVGLESKIDSTIDKLSEGQKQKVIIARALVARPRILIADEPLNNLDSGTQEKLCFLFDSINKLGTTVVMTNNKKFFQSNRKYRNFNINQKKFVEI